MKDDEKIIYDKIAERGGEGLPLSFSEIAAIAGCGEKAARRIVKSLLADGLIDVKYRVGYSPIYFQKKLDSDAAASGATDAQKEKKLTSECAGSGAPAEQKKHEKKIKDYNETRGTGTFSNWAEWEDELSDLGAESWTHDSAKKKGDATAFWEDGTMTEYTVEVDRGKLVIS